jgi:hypothetical protein
MTWSEALLVGVLAFVAALATTMIVNGCGDPNAAARQRNAEKGGLHAVELARCFETAKASDAGDQWSIYDACADDVDRRFGRK